jgi:hypothetical protein
VSEGLRAADCLAAKSSGTSAAITEKPRSVAAPGPIWRAAALRFLALGLGIDGLLGRRLVLPVLAAAIAASTRSHTGESIDASAWNTALAAKTDSATWALLKVARRIVTSRRNSRGSVEPTNAVTPAAIGGWTIARAMRSGNPKLRWIPLHAGTGISSTRETAAAHSMSCPTSFQVNVSTFARTRSTPPTSVGRITASSNKRSLRSDALPLTSDILSCPSLSGKQVAK